MKRYKSVKELFEKVEKSKEEYHNRKLTPKEEIDKLHILQQKFEFFHKVNYKFLESPSSLLLSYKKYLQIKDTLEISDLVSDGYIGRFNDISGKIKDEFHIIGKYYNYYSKNIVNNGYDEWIKLDNKKIKYFNCTQYEGFHYHFSVIYKIVEDLSIENNKLLYQYKPISNSILNKINKLVTENYKKNYDGILEVYKNTNNYIKLK